MNFISIWLYVIFSVFATALLLILNVAPVMLIKDGFESGETDIKVAGAIVGFIVYSLEIAIGLQVLFGRV